MGKFKGQMVIFTCLIQLALPEQAGHTSDIKPKNVSKITRYSLFGVRKKN